VVPEPPDRDEVHRIIYEELCRGRVEDASRAAYVAVIERLATEGAEAVILGCTEIGLLLRPSDSPLPVFDTTVLHAEAAVDFCVGG
jgi:aspartate racemase